MKTKYLLLACIIVITGYTQAQSRSPEFFKYKCGMSKEEVESIEKRKLIFWHSGMFGNPVYYFRNIDFHGKSSDINFSFTEKKLNNFSVIFTSNIKHPENCEQEFLEMKHRIIQEIGIAPIVLMRPPSLNAEKPLMDIIFKDKGGINLSWFLKGRSIGLVLDHHFPKGYHLEIFYSCSRKAMGLGPYKPKKKQNRKK
jgi:hypothetical protein